MLPSSGCGHFVTSNRFAWPSSRSEAKLVPAGGRTTRSHKMAYERSPPAQGGFAYCPRIDTPPSCWLAAMRADHSAGPVLWTLVPFESTATVTGMSTTSNS
jgi:hypothetical protein